MRGDLIAAKAKVGFRVAAVGEGELMRVHLAIFNDGAKVNKIRAGHVRLGLSNVDGYNQRLGPFNVEAQLGRHRCGGLLHHHLHFARLGVQATVVVGSQPTGKRPGAAGRSQRGKGRTMPGASRTWS
jgi:hypothetical protein